MTIIIADSPAGQLSRVKAWLEARGGKWTRGLALAACEGWSGRADAARRHQELQVSGLVPGVAPALETAAVGDTWAALELSVDGRRAELPEPSRALAEAVWRRMAERVPKPVPELPQLPNPLASLRDAAVVVGVIAAAMLALDLMSRRRR